MRASSSAHALGLLFVFPLACAVYQDDALKPVDGAIGLGGSSNVGGSNNDARAGSGVAAGTAGQASAGTTGSQGGSAGSGGNGGSPNITGGSSTQEGGDATGGVGPDEPSAGTGGVGGNGGVAGKAGSGGGGAGGHGGTLGGAGAGGGAAGTGGAAGSGGAAGNAGAAGSAGNGGSGGQNSAPKCSDHPIPSRSSWTASASHFDSKNSGVPANLLDNMITRWSTGKAQSGDEWLQLDFGSKVTLNHVNLQQGDDTNDYPRAYSVIVSDTAKDLSGTVLLTGSGKSGVSTAITLPALATGRYLLIKQTGSSLSWWSAEEIEVSCSE